MCMSRMEYRSHTRENPTRRTRSHAPRSGCTSNERLNTSPPAGASTHAQAANGWRVTPNVNAEATTMKEYSEAPNEFA